MSGSPVIDAGNPASPGSGGNACESTDIYGTLRPQGRACDIGAVEAIICPDHTVGGIEACDDGNVCTANDTCSAGTCEGTRIPGCFVCGDANGDDMVSATDGLIALQTAVGIGGCADFLCDVDRSGRVMATDALQILKRATGQLIDLLCGTADSSTTTTAGSL